MVKYDILIRPEVFELFMGLRGAGRCLKSFLEVIRFILAKYGTISSHGDPIHDQKYTIRPHARVRHIVMFVFFFLYLFLFGGALSCSLLLSCSRQRRRQRRFPMGHAHIPKRPGTNRRKGKTPHFDECVPALDLFFCSVSPSLVVSPAASPAPPPIPIHKGSQAINDGIKQENTRSSMMSQRTTP